MCETCLNLYIQCLCWAFLHDCMPHSQAQSFSLHVEGTLSSVFSAVPPCNTTGKLFIEAGFKGGERAIFIEVILLLCEIERTAWCLLSSLLQSAFTFPNLYHLWRENYTMLRAETSVLQQQQWFSKPKSTLKDSRLVLDSSVEMKRLQNVPSDFLWLYWQWVGGQIRDTLVSAEGEFSGLWADFVLYHCQPDYEISPGCKNSKTSK